MSINKHIIGDRGVNETSRICWYVGSPTLISRSRPGTVSASSAEVFPHADEEGGYCRLPQAKASLLRFHASVAESSNAEQRLIKKLNRELNRTQTCLEPLRKILNTAIW